MTQRPFDTLYTTEQRTETVEFDIRCNDVHETFDIMRLLLEAYVPSLASLFRFPGVRSVRLDDVTPESFEVFIGWLRFEHFTGGSNSLCPGIKPGQPSELTWPDDDSCTYYHSEEPLIWDHAANFSDYTEAAVNMYIFANKYEIPRLRQDAIDRLVWCNNWMFINYIENPDYYHNHIGIIAIETLYRNTKPGDPLRGLLSEGYHDYGDQRDVALGQLPKDFLVDILCKAWDKKCESYGPWRDPCKYHGHATLVAPPCTLRIFMDLEP